MKPHIKIYFSSFNYDESSFIPCQVCQRKATDIHHIQPKGMGGRKDADIITNLIALCRDCHNKAHDNKISKELLIKLQEKKIKIFKN